MKTRNVALIIVIIALLSACDSSITEPTVPKQRPRYYPRIEAAPDNGCRTIVCMDSISGRIP